jgi:hypothetical protein
MGSSLKVVCAAFLLRKGMQAGPYETERLRFQLGVTVVR